MCRSALRSITPARRTRRQPAELRVSDADRERLIARLREHHAQGRLTLEELEARVGRAQDARVFGDLHALERDLPEIALPHDRHAAVREQRAELAGQASRYLAVMVLLVAIWALTGAGYFWPIWPMLGWGIGLLAHARPQRARTFLGQPGSDPL